MQFDPYAKFFTLCSEGYLQDDVRGQKKYDRSAYSSTIYCKVRMLRFCGFNDVCDKHKKFMVAKYRLILLGSYTCKMKVSPSLTGLLVMF